MRSNLNHWLQDADFPRILDAVSRKPGILSRLITCTLSENTLICWRAIDAIGRCAEQWVTDHPKTLRNYLQRLFWMMSDEAGTAMPHAPEMIGEIVRSDTREFSDCIPLVISMLKMEPEDLPLFLPGILYALGRIGQTDPPLVDEALEGIETSLTVSDPQARAMAIQCLSRIGSARVLLRYPQLETDSVKVQIYNRAQLQDRTIAELFRNAV